MEGKLLLGSRWVVLFFFSFSFFTKRLELLCRLLFFFFLVDFNISSVLKFSEKKSGKNPSHDTTQNAYKDARFPYLWYHILPMVLQ